jgi:hypothetical protein
MPAAVEFVEGSLALQSGSGLSYTTERRPITIDEIISYI